MQGHRRPDESLNTDEHLENIIRKYWPEIIGLSGFERMKQLSKMRLPRLTEYLAYTEPCPRCGNTKWVMYGLRNGKLQCLVCRQYTFPRAGNVEELLPFTTPPVVQKNTCVVHCKANCIFNKINICQRKTININAFGICESRTKPHKEDDSGQIQDLDGD